MSEEELAFTAMVATSTEFKVEGGPVIVLTLEEKVSLPVCLGFLDDHWDEAGVFYGLSQEKFKLDEHPIVKGLKRPLRMIAETMACSHCASFIPRSSARKRHVEKRSCRNTLR